MQNSAEDGSIMVGMDQCRISSLESNASSTDPLLDGGSKAPQKSTSSTRGAPFYSQKSRGSHSSGGSCSTGQDDLCGTGTTEQEPLIPKTKNESDPEPEERSGPDTVAHVNKLHFVLFDPCQVGEDVVGSIPAAAPQDVSEDTLLGTHEGPRVMNGDGSRVCEGAEEIQNHERVKLKHDSKDTVCSSSSSATTATAMAASTHSSDKSSKLGARGGGRLCNNKEKRLRHLSTDTDDTSDISATLEPPDGGWGWVVVAASFLVNCIADGVTFSFGVFFLEFTNFFKATGSTTAWIGSLLAAIPLLSGPIASAAVDRYGCRNVTIVGGCLAALGFVLSSYTTSIYVLMITFGVITGFGLSLCYVAAVVIVAYYFERRRSFATGLSVCGGGIGTFLFAPLSQALIDRFGWQKTTLILAGAFLGLCFCGLLMKDLEWTKKKNKGANNNNSNGSHHHYNLTHGCGGNTLPCHHHHHHHCSTDKSNLSLGVGKTSNRRCNSAICIPTFVQEQERRERRQRYYSCNQDYDAPPPSAKDPSVHSSVDTPLSRKSSRKYRDSIRSRILSNHSNRKEAQPDSSSLHPPLSDEGLCPPPPVYGDEHLPTDLRLSPAGVIVDSLEIPDEKDKTNTSMTKNGEIVDFAQNHNHQPQHTLRSGSGNERSSSRQTEQCSSPSPTLNPDPPRILNNDGSESCSNSNNKKGDATTLTSSSTDLFNCNYHNNIQMSNNSSVTNLNNNHNGQLAAVGDGLKRENSGSSSRRHLHRNRSYNNSFNSNSTKDAAAATAPPPSQTNSNGIPTIIIPPGQQFKGENHYKLDMINSVRYRSVMHRHSLTYRGAVVNLKRYRLRPASSCPDIISVATSTEGHDSLELVNVAGDVCRWMKSVCAWENVMNTRFLLFILSNLLLYTWYDVPYMYLQTAAVHQGYSEDLSSYLISSIGLFNVVGNIFLGYLGDKEWASATIVYGVCMIICGGATVLMPYLMEVSYAGLITICGLFGLTIAANYALTSVILVQVVSLERFANAYGLLLLVQGIGNLVGPPIAGMISDATGTNTWSFLVAGVGIFASSFFVLAPIFQKELQPDSGTTPAGDPHNHQAQGGHVGHNHNDTV